MLNPFFSNFYSSNATNFTQFPIKIFIFEGYTCRINIIFTFDETMKIKKKNVEQVFFSDSIEYKYFIDLHRKINHPERNQKVYKCFWNVRVYLLKYIYIKGLHAYGIVLA